MINKSEVSGAVIKLIMLRLAGCVSGAAFITLAALIFIAGRENYFEIFSAFARIAGCVVLPLLLFPGAAAYLAGRYSRRGVIIFSSIAEAGIIASAIFILAAASRDHKTVLMYALFLLGIKHCLFLAAFNGLLPDYSGGGQPGRLNGVIGAAVALSAVAGILTGFLLFRMCPVQAPFRLESCGWLFPVPALLGCVLAFTLPGNPGKGSKQGKSPRFCNIFSLIQNSPGCGLAITAEMIGYFYLSFVAATLTLKSLQLNEGGGMAEFLPAAGIIALLAGVSAGSLAAAWISRRKMETGLILAGYAGMTLSMLLLAFTVGDYGAEKSLFCFFRHLAALIPAGFTAGVSIIAADRFRKSKIFRPEHESVFSAFGVTANYGAVAAAGMLVLILGGFLSMSPQELYWLAVAGTAAVTAAMTTVNPELLFRFLVLLLTRTLYRFKVHNAENIPAAGPVLLVANHVSFFDTFFIAACTERRVHFMVHQDFYRLPLLYPLLRWAGFLEVPAAQHPKQMGELFRKTREILAAGGVICVFPEGSITRNGIMQGFKKGIRQMLPEKATVPVVPVRLGMVWGSLFTILNDKLKFMPPHELPIPVSANIGIPISPDLSAYQIRQIMSELAAEAEMPLRKGERTLHYHFARSVKRHPFRKTFRDFEGPVISDFSILVRALLLSREIRKIVPDDCEYVGVMLPNCTAHTVTLLAVMMADKTPAILNFTAGTGAMELAMAKTGSECVLSSKAFVHKAQITPCARTVFLEDIAVKISRDAKFWTALAAALLPTRRLMKHYSPDSYSDVHKTAAVLFSSGSTGDPKGVMLTHHNFNSDFFSFWRVIGWRKNDRLIGNLPLFHSFGLMVCFWFPAMSGTEIVYTPNPLDAVTVCRLVQQHRITLMMATPTFLQAYMRRVADGQLKSLRLVITGGEKLRQDIADKFKFMTGLTLVEGYGCTELSPIVSINLSNSMLTLGAQAGKYGSIGVPLPGICVRIVDPDTGTPLPENTPGLMQVKAATIMKGYLNDPENTALAIRDGWYNTGDIAKMDWDGYLTITGRLSRFSKIGGEMVPHELVEMKINEILESEERCVAVCGREDAKKGEKLVVFHTAGVLDPATVVEELRRRGLPNLWIPKADDFIGLEKIPLLGNSKVDLLELRRMLKEL